MKPLNMPKLFLLLLPLASPPAIAQKAIRLKVVAEERIPRAVYEQVAIGGPSDTIQCGPDGSIWIPALRGYSETVSALVKYSMHETLKIDIDSISDLVHGSIDYFSPLSDGGVIALVRSVKRYSRIDGRENWPQRYGNSFAVKFTPQGKVLSRVRLSIEGAVQQPSKLTGLAELANGWMVVGSTVDGERIQIRAFVFDSSGRFRSELALPNSSAKASNSNTASTRSVFRPTVVTEPDGTFLVLRGYSDQAVYHISNRGKLLGTIKLNPNGIIFWSPRVLGDRLFVHAGVSSPQLGELGGLPVVQPRAAFGLFDLGSGELSTVFTLDGDFGGEVGCYQNDGGVRLTLIEQRSDRNGPFWMMRVLEPASNPSKSPKS